MGGQYAVEMNVKRPSSIDSDSYSNVPKNMKDYIKSKTDPVYCLSYHCLILSLLYSKSDNHIYPKSDEAKSVKNQELEKKNKKIIYGNTDCNGTMTVVPSSLKSKRNSHTPTSGKILSPKEVKTSFTGSINIQSGFTLTALKDCDTASDFTAYKSRPIPSKYEQLDRDTDEDDGEFRDELSMPVMKRRNTPWPSGFDKYIVNQVRARSGAIVASGRELPHSIKTNASRNDRSEKDDGIEIESSRQGLPTNNNDAPSRKDNECDGMIANSTGVALYKLKRMEDEHKASSQIPIYDVYID